MTSPLELDFKDVQSLLKKKYRYIPKNLKCFKKLHKSVFSIASFVYEISELNSERMDFLNEVRSDYIELLLCICLNIKKSVFSSTRSSIEHVLLHIYYKEHPIEFEQLSSNPDPKIPTQFFFEYVKKHPYLIKFKGILKNIQFLETEFHNLSKFMHGPSKNYLQLDKSIDDKKFSKTQEKMIIENIVKLSDHLLTILIIFHWNEFKTIPSQKQTTIMSNVSYLNKRTINKLNES